MARVIPQKMQGSPVIAPQEVAKGTQAGSEPAGRCASANRASWQEEEIEHAPAPGGRGEWRRRSVASWDGRGRGRFLDGRNGRGGRRGSWTAAGADGIGGG